MKKITLKRSMLSLCVSAISLHSLSALAGGVTATDPSQTQVHTAGNGSVLVNIAAPNAHGVSHNQYNEFNVSEAGVGLNNIASGARANGNLNGNAASIILNEVVGNSRSNLNGRVSVLGQQAEFILANPNGIDCNGCSFGNVSGATLTTGIPELDENGVLTGYRVNGGDVHIGTAGADVSNLDYFKVISSSFKNDGVIQGIQVDAEGKVQNAADVSIHLAKDGRFDRSKGHIEGQSKVEPMVIDAAQLGSIYANKIHIKTAEGMGVSTPKDGTINALDLFEVAATEFTNKGALTAKSYDINAKAVVNEGLLYSKNSSRIKTESFGSGSSHTNKRASIGTGSGKLTIESHNAILGNNDFLGNIEIKNKYDVTLENVEQSANSKLTVNSESMYLYGQNNLSEIEIDTKEFNVINGNTYADKLNLDSDEIIIESDATLYSLNGTYSVKKMTGDAYGKVIHVKETPTTLFSHFKTDDGLYLYVDDYYNGDIMQAFRGPNAAEEVKDLMIANKGDISLVFPEDYHWTVNYISFGMASESGSIRFINKSKDKKFPIIEGKLLAKKDIELKDMGLITIRKGAVVKADGKVDIDAYNLDILNGQVQGNEVNVKVKGRLKLETEMVRSKGKYTHVYTINGEKIPVGRKIKTKGQNGEIHWKKTEYNADEGLRYNAEKSSANKAVLSAKSNLSINAGNIENKFGKIVSGQTMEINAENGLKKDELKAYQKEITDRKRIWHTRECVFSLRHGQKCDNDAHSARLPSTDTGWQQVASQNPLSSQIEARRDATGNLAREVIVNRDSARYSSLVSPKSALDLVDLGNKPATDGIHFKPVLTLNKNDVKHQSFYTQEKINELSNLHKQ